MSIQKFVAVLVCFAAAGLSLVLWRVLTVADDGAITQARFLLAQDEQPPTEQRTWESVQLPDSWSISRHLAEGIGWYRIEFQAPADPDRRLAVFVRRLSMNGELFINGVRFFSGGRMTEPVTRNWNVPVYAEIPAPLLRPGRNVLDVRLFAYRNNNGGLGRVEIGDAEDLRLRHLGLLALHVKGAVLSFAVAALAACFGAVAWWRMGRKAIYGLFGLAMLCWTIRYANYFVQEVPLDHAVYSLVVNSAQGWFFVFFTPFLLRMSKKRWRWLENTLLAFGVIGTLCIAGAFRGLITLNWVTGIWAFVWAPGSVVLLWISIRQAWRSFSPRNLIAAFVVWLYVPLTFRELLITRGELPFDSSYVAHFVGVPLAVLIGWILVDRAVESEVARAHAALEERQRITQDMHDGLGLQLNAALRTVEKGEFDRGRWTEMLRACLDELRLIVDATSADRSDFLPLLASLRIRMQSRLEAIGIRIGWRMDRFPSDLRLAPETSLQVLRIVQEALNNAVKHSGANEIEFSVGEPKDPGHLVFRIADNGSGFDAGKVQHGKGLDGMRRRALKAGVGLAIDSSAGGTCIELQLPTCEQVSGS